MQGRSVDHLKSRDGRLESGRPSRTHQTDCYDSRLFRRPDGPDAGSGDLILTVVAIDPGVITGIAVANIDATNPHYCKATVLSLDQYSIDEFHTMIERVLHVANFVVIEDFHNAGAHLDSTPLKLIGVIDFLLKRVGFTEKHFAKVRPGSMEFAYKRFPETFKGLKRSSYPHSCDALGQMLTYAYSKMNVREVIMNGVPGKFVDREWF